MSRRNFPVLVAKEFREQVRSHRLLVILLAFVFFGLASPMLAKFTPDIVKSVSAGQGIEISVPEPTAADAVAQYVKNLSQIVLFVLVFLTMGAVVSEKERGTAVFVLVKPVSRSSFLAAKLCTLWASVSAGLVLSALCAYAYTTLLFAPPGAGRFALAGALLLAHILTFVTTTFFFSTAARSQAVAGVLSFLVWILLASLSNVGYVSEFLPGRLLSLSLEAALGGRIAWEPLVGSAALIVLSWVGAVGFLRRWEP
ncbi:MAG: ABC transporter permease [Candidatus Bipolaricaulota bacterium]